MNKVAGALKRTSAVRACMAVVFAACMVLALALSACSGASSSGLHPVVGTWETGTGITMTISQSGASDLAFTMDTGESGTFIGHLEAIPEATFDTEDAHYDTWKLITEYRGSDVESPFNVTYFYEDIPGNLAGKCILFGDTGTDMTVFTRVSAVPQTGGSERFRHP